MWIGEVMWIEGLPKLCKHGVPWCLECQASEFDALIRAMESGRLFNITQDKTAHDPGDEDGRTR